MIRSVLDFSTDGPNTTLNTFFVDAARSRAADEAAQASLAALREAICIAMAAGAPRRTGAATAASTLLWGCAAVAGGGWRCRRLGGGE